MLYLPYNPAEYHTLSGEATTRLPPSVKLTYDPNIKRSTDKDNKEKKLSKIKLKRAEAVWKSKLGDYNLEEATERSAKAFLLSAIENTYVVALKHKIKKYRATAYASLISHLCKNYTTLYAINAGQTFKDIKDYYVFEEGFTKYIAKMEDTGGKVKFVHAGLLNDNVLMTFGELAMGKSGLYKKEVDKLNNLPIIYKTWAKFKEHFSKAEAKMKHKIQRDEKAGGFGHGQAHAAHNNPFMCLQDEDKETLGCMVSIEESLDI